MVLWTPLYLIWDTNDFRQYFIHPQGRPFCILIVNPCCFVCRFNNVDKNPMKGVRYLQEQGLLGISPTEIAQFLINDDRLDKVWHVNLLSSIELFVISTDDLCF